ncbi:MAG TPA: hypothetical protein DDY91_17105 [Planctomycetaceae bacterium]|nr:hypothetical protein [Planctomycetaceae bacterium]
MSGLGRQLSLRLKRLFPAWFMPPFLGILECTFSSGHWSLSQSLRLLAETNCWLSQKGTLLPPPIQLQSPGQT